MKKCFSCKRKKFLFLFPIDNMKYQIKSDKGRCKECRTCTVKRFIKQNGSILRYNFDVKKFETITLKVNWINKIKIYFK